MTAPELVLDEGPVTLYRGDCREVMALLPENSVDAIVTDPPYELGFMGKRWDSSGIAYDPEVWAQAYRVLKPGGHALVFGGTRTWHRVAVAVEGAGFEIRDSIAWLYGSGFPKSLDVSKAIDKTRNDLTEIENVRAFLNRIRIDRGLNLKAINRHFGFADNGGGLASTWTTNRSTRAIPTWEQWLNLKEWLGFGDEMDAEVRRLNDRKGQAGDAWHEREVTGVVEAWENRTNFAMTTRDGVARDIALAGTAAAQWEGWGTALKPAFEPVVVARKPLVGTVAANVLAHGTGALNIDASRIGDEVLAPVTRGVSKIGTFEGADGNVTAERTGRFPSNVLLDESQAAELDRQTGTLTSGLMKARTERKPRPGGTIYGADKRNIVAGDTYADSGGGSRFFYVAKAGKDERPVVEGKQHATVKPLALMRYLVRLITPPGGTVLEPFAGSGTTLEACVIEGFNVIGAELDEDGKHIPLILKRLAKPHQQTLFGDVA